MEHLEEFQIPRDVLAKLRDHQWVGEQILQGRTFQDMVGFKDSTMERLYAKARALFLHERYEEAADAFVFLTTLNPHYYVYWIGLAMSEHLSGYYQEALGAYAMASICDPNNPIPHYHAATCYRYLSDATHELVALELAIRCCGDNKQHAMVKHKSKKLRSLIKK